MRGTGTLMWSNSRHGYWLIYIGEYTLSVRTTQNKKWVIEIKFQSHNFLPLHINNGTVRTILVNMNNYWLGRPQANIWTNAHMRHRLASHNAPPWPINMPWTASKAPFIYTYYRTSLQRSLCISYCSLETSCFICMGGESAEIFHTCR